MFSFPVVAKDYQSKRAICGPSIQLRSNICSPCQQLSEVNQTISFCSVEGESITDSDIKASIPPHHGPVYSYFYHSAIHKPEHLYLIACVQAEACPVLFLVACTVQQAHFSANTSSRPPLSGTKSETRSLVPSGQIHPVVLLFSSAAHCYGIAFLALFGEVTEYPLFRALVVTD